ncbi:hypothetical protein Tco_0324579 [Tanacetum coccineum]
MTMDNIQEYVSQAAAANLPANSGYRPHASQIKFDHLKFVTANMLHSVLELFLVTMLQPPDGSFKEYHNPKWCFPVKDQKAVNHDVEVRITLRVGKEAITFNMTKLQITQLITTYDGQQFDVIDMAVMITERAQLCEAKPLNPSVNEPPEGESRTAIPDLEYAFYSGDDMLCLS